MSGFCSSGPRRRFSIASFKKAARKQKHARDTPLEKILSRRAGACHFFCFLCTTWRPLYLHTTGAGPPAGGEQTHTFCLGPDAIARSNKTQGLGFHNFRRAESESVRVV